MNYCWKCGAKVEGEAKFCTNCGSDLTGKHISDSASNQKISIVEQVKVWGEHLKKNAPAKIIGLVLLLLLIWAFIVPLVKPHPLHGKWSNEVLLVNINNQGHYEIIAEENEQGTMKLIGTLEPAGKNEDGQPVYKPVNANTQIDAEVLNWKENFAAQLPEGTTLEDVIMQIEGNKILLEMSGVKNVEGITNLIRKHVKEVGKDLHINVTVGEISEIVEQNESMVGDLVEIDLTDFSQILKLEMYLTSDDQLKLHVPEDSATEVLFERVK